MANSYVRVKICGICDLETALRAVEAGADALGFVFAPGRRRVGPEQARQIAASLPPFVSRVGVFVNPSLEEVNDIAGYAGLDTIQLHGDEPPEFCSALGCRYRVVKSFAVAEKSDLQAVGRYRVNAYLLDARVPGFRGGTGRTFDWRLAENFRAGPLILAGGLNRDNVQEAVKIARPFAVDVSSGVETNGRKDYDKIREFVRRVKG
ncbi:MAG: phosphoribosylanthranilate isomerase [Peptococcaceae bacterium]|nr:phosphoribosylanthranilate isomerase [Peptococcaceae bacterium]